MFDMDFFPSEKTNFLNEDIGLIITETFSHSERNESYYK